MMLILLILSLSSWASAAFGRRSACIIQSGKLRIEGQKKGEHCEYLGIPYGSAERWKAAKLVPLPENKIFARQFGPTCHQLHGTPQDRIDKIVMKPRAPEIEESSKDGCLNLNVLTSFPRTDGSLRPVLVFIHGGQFNAYGSSTPLFDAGGLVNARPDDVVVVSLNYRLNVLGFMMVPEKGHGYNGNFGLLDQRLALEWVQKYITIFGGDPKNVTLMGQSAGSISVEYQLLMADKLGGAPFHKAIMLGGTAHGRPIVPLEMAEVLFKDLAIEVGCSRHPNFKNEQEPDEDQSQVLRCMRNKPAKKLIKAALALGYVHTWGPIIDGELFNGNVQEMLQTRKIPNIPIAIFSLPEETSLFVDKQVDRILHPNSKMNLQLLRDSLPLYEKFYPQMSKRDLLVRMMTDALLVGPNTDLVRKLKHRGLNNVGHYQMLTNWHWIVGLFSPKATGSFHGSELAYLFDFRLANRRLVHSPDVERFNLQLILLNFCREGEIVPVEGVLWAMDENAIGEEVEHWIKAGNPVTPLDPVTAQMSAEGFAETMLSECYLYFPLNCDDQVELD